MKKNINVNIFGTIYAFDEDAYQLLQNYLENMKSYFRKQAGGEEIADDIEHRIAELLWERKQAGATTVEIDSIRQILEELGDPEQMGASEANIPHSDSEEPQQDNQEDKKEDEKPSGIYGEEKSTSSYHRLYRDVNDKVIAGVLSGLTHYFGWKEPIILRLIFLICMFITVGYAILFYVILWICMKPAHTAEERLEMLGKDVTPESIKEEVLREDVNGKVPGETTSSNGCFKGCLWGCGCLLALFFLPVLFAFIIGLIATIFGIGTGIMGGLMGGIGGIFGGIGALLGGIGSMLGGIFSGNLPPGAHFEVNVPSPYFSYSVTERHDTTYTCDEDSVYLYDSVSVEKMEDVQDVVAE